MKNLFKACLLVIVLALGTGEAIGQFGWTQDARNPILSIGGIGAWNENVFSPCVLFNADSSRYEMWFVATSGAPWRPCSIGFASSKDGVRWNMEPLPVLSPTPGTWDAYTVEAPMVIRDSAQYKMWYSSFYNTGPLYPGYIGYATSPDGIHWTKHAGNPVLGLGTAAWEVGGPYSCDVKKVPGGYRMWYAACDSTAIGAGMGYATSSDGTTWQRDTVHNPLMKRGLPGEWDSLYVYDPQVLGFGATFYMWYTGSRGDNVPSVGVATSTDSGLTWTKNPSNPVLSPSAWTWNSTGVSLGTVLQRGDTLDLWYDGSSSRIGHATSLVTTGVADRKRIVPIEFNLAQNYPNPFNPSTTIKFELPRASRVALTVYDVLGRQVSVLVNERRNAGVYEVKFDGSELASGVYFYRIQAGDYVATKKLVLMK